MCSNLAENINKDSFKPCACGCGEMISKFDNRGRPRTYKQFHFFKINKFPHFGNDWNFRGGIHKHSRGYIKRVSKDHPRADRDGYVMEHILVYEKNNNVCVLPWGDIHHINGNKKDNRIENLQGVIHGKHQQMHQFWKTSPCLGKGRPKGSKNKKK